MTKKKKEDKAKSEFSPKKLSVEAMENLLGMGKGFSYTLRGKLGEEFDSSIRRLEESAANWDKVLTPVLGKAIEENVDILRNTPGRDPYIEMSGLAVCLISHAAYYARSFNVPKVIFQALVTIAWSWERADKTAPEDEEEREALS